MLDASGLDVTGLLSPNPEGAPFWRSLAEGRLELPRCDDCGQLFFYPRALCPHCGSRKLQWEEVSGTGRLYSFCVHFRTSLPGLTPALPFATGLVDLAEGPRVMGFLVGVPDDPERIDCDIAVRAEFPAVSAGIHVLAFRPTE